MTDVTEKPAVLAEPRPGSEVDYPGGRGRYEGGGQG